MKSTTTTSTKIITIVNRLACSSLESLWGIFSILVFLALNPTASSREILESNPKKTNEYREFEFIKRYCFECHSGEKPKASLDLSRFDSMDKILSEALLWDDILIRLSQGDMPPKEAELPTLNERSEFLNWIESSLQKAACQSGPHAGPAGARAPGLPGRAARVVDRARPLWARGGGNEGRELADRAHLAQFRVNGPGAGAYDFAPGCGAEPLQRGGDPLGAVSGRLLGPRAHAGLRRGARGLDADVTAGAGTAAGCRRVEKSPSHILRFRDLRAHFLDMPMRAATLSREPYAISAS